MVVEKSIKVILIKSMVKSSRLGGYQFFILISLIFLSLGYFREFLFLGIGLFLLYFFAIPIRLIFFKNRPIKRIYTNLFEKIDASSIPSMHSARTIFLYLFLMNFFEFKIFFSLLITIVSFSIIYSRIYKKQHDKIDVLAGIILGIIIWFFIKNIILIL